MIYFVFQAFRLTLVKTYHKCEKTESNSHWLPPARAGGQFAFGPLWPISGCITGFSLEVICSVFGKHAELDVFGKHAELDGILHNTLYFNCVVIMYDNGFFFRFLSISLMPTLKWEKAPTVTSL